MARSKCRLSYKPQPAPPWIGFKARSRKNYKDLSCISIFSLFWPCQAAYRILVPRPGIELRPPALGVQSLNHWIPREFPMTIYFAPVCTVLEVRSPTQCHWAHIKVLADGVLSGDSRSESAASPDSGSRDAHTPWCSAPCIHQPSDGWWSVSH